jgi:hypothetical protein
VFDMFTQADKTLDRAQGGLGIGLTLVRRLVELRGDTIEAQRGPGAASSWCACPGYACRSRSRASEHTPNRPDPLTRAECWWWTTTWTARKAPRCYLELAGQEVRVA